MPYSCCTIATSNPPITSTAVAALRAEPFTRSQTTSGAVRGAEPAGTSRTRTTLTWSPGPRRCESSAALNVASPHWVGGYVLSSAYVVGITGLLIGVEAPEGSPPGSVIIGPTSPPTP